MKKKLVAVLWDSFIEEVKSPGVLDSYLIYYLAIVNWITNNTRYFGDNSIKSKRLEICINLDPTLYVIDEPELSLSMELDRLERIKPSKMDTLVMVIEDTLWDLVTIKSGKDCPNCTDDELRYVLAKNESKLLLECDTCGWIEYENGCKWDGGYTQVIPASKNDLLQFGI
ncbi:hypothetical protein ACFO25_19975 [Paenactinomyces guangxiensis]|uniref:Uncharacterized protein n=1 Tax=Paenactinomyces guangxiensis TaxID=1490290 RepID=A0A7W1WTF2_9BACL|nr:hypothetical protein [Paenactinomyces guangxiensis]MBA4495502.1 hypothetical protein [Paenactinomyces guangxiensis]MBA4495506.1 hypothetical protein [Paenactinomyces guangxiensis]MBH8593651.1 hypothetical protein [Paenactinomyces guangxiensis]